MQLIIESPGMAPDEQLIRFIQQKFQRLERLYDRILKIVVVLRKEKHNRKKNCRVEAHVSAPKKLFFSGLQEEAFEKAAAEVAESLEQQLRRHKTEREEIW
jgi:ribosomal subunit interface protein